jgi:hypothetical protein
MSESRLERTEKIHGLPSMFSFSTMQGRMRRLETMFQINTKCIGCLNMEVLWISNPVASRLGAKLKVRLLKDISFLSRKPNKEQAFSPAP